MALVLFEQISKNIGKLVLNDPDHLNAMGEDMAEEFKAQVESLKSSSDLRALILTGAGRAFSAGGHLDMLEKKTQLSGEENRLRMLHYYDCFLSVLDLGVPLVAAINGHAIGAGLCVACACDIRICSDKAKLGLTFTKLGLHPGMGASFSLPQLVGRSVAAELMLTGRVIQSDKALALGLVSEVLETDKVLERAEQVCMEITSCGPEANAQLVQSLRAGSLSLKQSLEREASNQAINYASSEFKEGIRAAIEKRPAKF